jgi:hypothetical protein
VDPEQGEDYVANVKEKVQRAIGSAYTVTSIDWKYTKLYGRPTNIKESTLVWTATGPPYWNTWRATTIRVREYGVLEEKELRIGGMTGGGTLQFGRPRQPPGDRTRKGKREREVNTIPFPTGRVTLQQVEDWKEANKRLREAPPAEEGGEGGEAQ